MIPAIGITGEHRLRLELIEITKKLAPEKLGAVLESLSPTGLSDLTRSAPEVGAREPSQPRLRGKELLEQAISIFK